VTQSRPALHKEVLKYLQVTGHALAEQQAQALWDEAQTLLDIATWQDRLSAEEFWPRFAPHAEASQALRRLLEGCSQVVLLAATLGGRLEERVRTYSLQGEAFSAYILDRLGSYLVEQRMRGLDRQVRQRAQDEGLAATRRYSPGYQDFSLEAQAVFLDLAGGALPCLRLSPSGLLQPEKTITALKGLHPPRPN
jgi:hypothetical protein